MRIWKETLAKPRLFFEVGRGLTHATEYPPPTSAVCNAMPNHVSMTPDMPEYAPARRPPAAVAVPAANT